MAKVANIIAIYTKTRNIILEFQSLGNTIELFLILFPTLSSETEGYGRFLTPISSHVPDSSFGLDCSLLRR
jgi:hypothetical protein